MGAPIGRILKELSGRYPLTMLGGWSERRVSAYRTLIEKSPFAALATCDRRGWIALRAAISPASFVSMTTGR